MTDYLTVVFRQPIGPAARTLLESGEWTAASHSHAIHDRDEAKQEAEKLRAEIERLRAELEVSRNQKPAYWGPRCAINGGYTTFVAGMFKVNPTDVPLYLAAGAQPAPIQEVYDWPEGATHYQPQQKAFYKRVSACEWYVWSRITDEPLHWSYSPGTMDSAEWIVRAQPAPSVPTIDRDTVYGDGFHDGYWKAKSEGMTADERKAVEALLADYDENLAAWSEKRERDGWDAIEEDESARIVRAMLADPSKAPKRKPLTDEQIDAMRNKDNGNLNFTFRSFRIIARAVEAAHGIKENRND